jgi:hypothetical protein
MLCLYCSHKSTTNCIEDKKKNPTKAQRDLNPGSREEKNETLLQEQDYQLIASVTQKNSNQFNQTQLHESSKGSPNKKPM